MTSYSLELCAEDETEAAFEIYARRVQWMDAKKLRHWNYYRYLELFPLSYFKRRQAEGLFYACKNDKGALVGAVALLPNDPNWPDGDRAAAYYIHNLATDPSAKGVGLEMMRLIRDKATSDGKQFLRLDCDEESAFLNEYYARLGYRPVGKCHYGPYRGVRRELILERRAGCDGRF